MRCLIGKLTPLIALLAASGSVGATGNTAGPDSAVAEQWVSACNSKAVVTRRTGEVDLQDVLSGIRVLRHAGLIDKLSSQEVDEACLTLVGSGGVGTPAISLLKPLPGSLPPAENPAMGFQPLEEAMTEKLRRLDLGFFVPAPGKSPVSTYAETYEQYPLEAKRASWQSLMLQMRVNQRSLSSHYEGYCIIINDQSPLTDYVDKTFQGNLSDALNAGDRRWLGNYGPAMEFWHEAAHCQISPTAETVQPQKDQDVMVRADADGAGCGATGFARQMKDLAIGKSEIPGDVMQVYGRDIRILYELGSEVFADQKAYDVLSDRFGLHRPGCRSPEDSVDTPWARFRMADSAVNPSIIHMTWLAPFLANQSIPNQAHALSDAWSAVKTVAFEDITGPTKPSLVRMLVAKRPAGHSYSPTVNPDSDRKARWLEWLRRKMRL